MVKLRLLRRYPVAQSVQGGNDVNVHFPSQPPPGGGGFERLHHVCCIKAPDCQAKKLNIDAVKQIDSRREAGGDRK